jgi:cytochrome b involved in lipid metabolism
MGLVIIVILCFFFSFYRKVSALSLVLRVLVAVLSIATITMTIFVGHSGAESVWKDRYAAAKVPLALSLDEFTPEEVAEHNSATDCWTIVNGFVYDMTSFANRHPVGSSAITEMCGVNASEEFLDEHDGQREPNEWLETLKIGRLK